jgi:hypothetical protein
MVEFDEVVLLLALSIYINEFANISELYFS